ncbi:uncharacterized protein LOC133711869 [Rosa rugosa]|uniref:uncharacterized protein LOC133711869 n=1 Tax=Rosa rugosa TaxID=74645 RepID=UPI002B40654F|nr:uncharacterized protein LOC133711869 [Rosa rugosa]
MTSLIFLSETLAAPDLLTSVRRNLGFDGCFCVESKDECRDLALLWRNEVPVRLRNYSSNHIDAEVGELGSDKVFRFTGIYGVTRTSERIFTWDLLRALARQSPLPWLVAGDFNEILCQADKSGGPPRSATQMNRFRQTLVDCALLDMGFVGSRFTWSNRTTKERLDRACRTLTWREMFSFSRTITLPLSKSDHNPLLIEVNPEPPCRMFFPKRFRFEEMWYQHEGCSSVVDRGWMTPSTGAPMLQVGQKIKHTGNLLLEWHAGVFQQRHVEMRLVQDKLATIMSKPFEPSQFEEQKALQFRLNELLTINETYWRQRSRIQWLKEGDRNTPFFHRRASNRRSRNKVTGITNEEGMWTSDPDQISETLVRYYENIFHTEGSDSAAISTVLQALQPKVTDSMNEVLLAPYTDEEIKKALFQMHPSKSPGPDGMSPFFFQKFWNVVHHDVCLAVKHVLQTGQLSQESNFTHLTLIPKVKEPKLASDLRPIALCNVVYKIASKVLANRLKVLLPQIISPLQSAFVPGRLISDNTLIATEVAHFMKKLRQQADGFFSLKLDISKAYDRLEWSYLEAVLLRLGFCSRWVDVVMATIKSVSYSILINGAPTGFILPTRGIRQGDPLSPYLFILCAEGLSALISSSVQHGTIKDILGVQCVSEHGLYLGLPIHIGHSKVAIFAYLKERLTKKLISWRSKLLSAGGKEVLIKAVAQTIPTYAMSCYMLPKSLCDDLQQLCADFFWGSTDQKKKIHWRSWERMCLPKEEGGISFKHLHAHNLSMLAKQGWRLISNPDSLVAQVLKAVYYPHGTFLTADMGDRPSFSWRSILEARSVLQAGLYWKIGTGTKVSIWEDNWIPNTPPHLLNKPEDTIFELVADLIDHNSCSWNVAAVHLCFPTDVAAKVMCLPLSRRFNTDRFAWKLEPKGFFSVKSAYRVARELSMGTYSASTSSGDPYAPLWKALWNAKVPSKVAIFGWRACHNILPTRAALSTKGYTGDLHCVLCSAPYESIGHVLCDCAIAKSILQSPPFSIPIYVTLAFNLKEWLLERVLSLPSHVFDKLLIILWSIWKNRNDKLWNDKEKYNSMLIASAMAWYEEYLRATQSRDHSTSPKHAVTKKWIPPRAFCYRQDFVSSPLHVELLAIQQGLRFMQQHAYLQAELESDCLLAVHAISSSVGDLSPLSPLVADIKGLLVQCPTISLHHVRRDGNRVAHRLASISFDSNLHQDWFTHAPDFILDALVYDVIRMN